MAGIKKIFCRSDLWSKISHVLVMAALNVFPINSLLGVRNTVAKELDLTPVILYSISSVANTQQ